jgi:hypothetical protein
MADVFVCSRCEWQCREFGYLLKHYQHQHSMEPGFSIVCGITSCSKKFVNVKTFGKHIRTKHAKFYDSHMAPANSMRESNLPLQSTAVCDNDVNNGIMDSQNVTDNVTYITTPVVVNETAMTQLESSCHYVASMSMKLREHYRVSGRACEEIRDSMSHMLTASREMMCEEVKSKLQASGASPSLFNAVVETLSTPTDYEHACNSLAKEYSVNRYVENHFLYTEPVAYSIPASDNVSANEPLQYVPIAESLRALLMNDDVFADVMNGHKSGDGLMRDFCDGSRFREHPLLSIDPMTLQIILYYDDFGTVNPLGHRAKAYTVSGFYYMLGNLQPKNRSRLHVLQLVAICFKKAIKKCGFDSMLGPLINDLTMLSSTGVSVDRPEGTFTFKATLFLIVGDNLGAHSLGGFFESFTATHPCRFCMISRENLSSTLNSHLVTKRTEENYKDQIDRVTRDQALQSVYGLKKVCCLNQVPFFHVVDGMPSDIMHDLLEGVVCDVLESVIKYCVDQEFITFLYLNDQIETFPYHVTDKPNKPDAVPSSLGAFKFRQTAAKSRCFLRLLPAMIGSMVPSGDSKWEVLLCLLDVVDLVFAPALSVSDTALIDDAVETFLDKFTVEFPNESFKPKMHFLIHYGEQYRKFGPLINCWSFRFEAKHGYFKEIASKIKCRKNILQSMARKHQYLNSYYLSSKNYLHGEVSHSGDQINANSLPTAIRYAVNSVIGDEECVFVVKVLCIDGIEYHNDMCVLTGVCAEKYALEFGKITLMLMANGKPFFVVCQLQTSSYMRHYHMHTAQETGIYRALTVSDLLDPFPLPLYNMNSAGLAFAQRHYYSIYSVL